MPTDSRCEIQSVSLVHVHAHTCVYVYVCVWESLGVAGGGGGYDPKSYYAYFYIFFVPRNQAQGINNIANLSLADDTFILTDKDKSEALNS